MGNSFEDQITSLHPEMPVLSEEIYRVLSLNDNDYLDFPNNEFYKKFSKPLDILDNHGLIKLRESVYATPQGIEYISPKYRTYLYTFCKDQDK